MTGAGAGIGKQLCLQLHRLGCIVVCVDVDLESCGKTAEKITEEDGVAFRQGKGERGGGGGAVIPT